MNRLTRNNIFDSFFNKSGRIFKTVSEKDPANNKFHNKYTLHIVPGGRHGGLDKTLIEIFYGSRAIGKKDVFENFSIK